MASPFQHKQHPSALWPTERSRLERCPLISKNNKTIYVYDKIVSLVQDQI